MKIIFTKSQSVLSKAIRGVTNEPCSHTALVFDFGLFDFVIHSNLLGLHIDSSDYFFKHSELVYSLEKTQVSVFDNIKNKSRLKKLLDKSEGAWYDFGGLLFMGLMLTLRHYLKIPMPKSNLWQSTGMFECTEWVTEFVDSEEDSLITPYKLYLKLKETNVWRDTNEQKESRPSKRSKKPSKRKRS